MSEDDDGSPYGPDYREFEYEYYQAQRPRLIVREEVWFTTGTLAWLLSGHVPWLTAGAAVLMMVHLYTDDRVTHCRGSAAALYLAIAAAMSIPGVGPVLRLLGIVLLVAYIVVVNVGLAVRAAYARCRPLR